MGKKIEIVVRLAAAVVLAGLMGSAALADAVKDLGGLPYEGKIKGVSAKGLLMDWKMGGEKAFAWAQIKQITVDGQVDLNAAEELTAKGDTKGATAKYVTAKGKIPSGWLRDFVNARLVEAYGQSDQLSKSVKAYIELCSGGSDLANKVKKPRVLAKGNAENAAAMKDIDDALAANPKATYAENLKKLRISILMTEGDPASVLKIIDDQLKDKTVDADTRQQARVQHIAILLKMGKYDEAKASLEIATKGEGADGAGRLDAQYQPQLYFYQGQMLYATKDFVHAALEFTRVPAGYAKSQKELSATALYWAAKSMQEAKVVPANEVVIALQWAQEFPGTEGAAESKKMLDQLDGNQ